MYEELNTASARDICDARERAGRNPPRERAACMDRERSCGDCDAMTSKAQREPTREQSHDARTCGAGGEPHKAVRLRRTARQRTVPVNRHETADREMRFKRTRTSTPTQDDQAIADIDNTSGGGVAAGELYRILRDMQGKCVIGASHNLQRVLNTLPMLGVRVPRPSSALRRWSWWRTS